MAVSISRALAAELLALASDDPDREVCGLLLGSADRIEAIAPARNVAADPRRAFEIDPAVLFAAYRAERAGYSAVIGYYHSHPNGRCEPSVADFAQAPDDGRLWLILAGDALGLWKYTPERFARVVHAVVD